VEQTVKNRAECHSEEGYKGSSPAMCNGSLGAMLPHRVGITRRGLFYNLRGFTLIELVVAMAILLVVVIGVLSSVAYAYTSSNGTEMRNTAKNVGSYTLEYLRARTVTRGNTVLYNLLTPSGALAVGTYRWYDADPLSPTYNRYGAMPSMIDIGDLPLQSNGYPCNYMAQSPTNLWAGTLVDNGSWRNLGSGGDIGANGSVVHFASKHAALPTETYGTSTTAALAWVSTLQGYVSVRDKTPASLEATATEDQNLSRRLFSSVNVYRTLLASTWTGPIVRYPGVWVSAASPGVKSFTPLTSYLARVYTTDASDTGKMKTTNPEYNPYYTNVASDQAKTQAYRGFRVLTQVVARSTKAVDAYGFRHVEYYDVTVTVLWMNGTKESSYELVSRILVY
jgi:prepilin-type N-terminal cleavage/methylation domain-containing protein